MATRCTCPPMLGDRDPCDFCVAFETWRDERADLRALALDFADSTPALSGQFNAYLADKFGPIFARERDEAAEAQWEAVQARYVA